MSKVLIVYWSRYGNTKKVADSIAKGIIKAAKKVEVVVKNVKDTKPEEVLDYDALIIGSANHMGGPVGDIKNFLKKLEKLNLKGKACAVFDTHNKNDLKVGQKMEKQIQEKISGLKLVAPSLALQVEGMQGPIAESELAKAEEFGKSISTKI
ncbi:MAG: flavodoxin domain-containing protein [Candidatus Freyarchaeum deiterrae]